ncbi:magnesium transporter [Qipengyuania sp. MTN3-11]|uniref:magnesium transporter n=1 Tax=Qipengyuania sp. MTN3-11 TaxID=3056557 RepID=UPI0036F24985
MNVAAVAPPMAEQSSEGTLAAPAGETVADLMTEPVGIFSARTTVGEAIEVLREATQSAFITYCYIVDPEDRLIGLVVMREMLFATPETPLAEIMIPNPFVLRKDMTLADALSAALKRHFPVYPVVDSEDRLAGLVRGADLFANRAVEISAQAGAMVGVEKEERLSTPLLRSLKLRHPWLQVNLLTAFVAAAVVGIFEDTLSRLVILAVFLPVMAGQTGNTGCQALAVALRGMTLGEVKAGSARTLVRKEGMLGFANGLLVGLTAGTGMFAYALMQGEAEPVRFGIVVLVAMVVACTISGIAGALIPLTLKRLGADPATASSIFLTTASDVASMGIFLSLATILL